MRDTPVAFDPLYGELAFTRELRDLIAAPIVQRLRGIRLSNIDSLAMPGLAGVTRYEHSLGTLHIASRTTASRALSHDDRLVFHAAALLHDSLIPGLGHLVEEALQYANSRLDHERYWETLLSRESSGDIGGPELQIYLGKQSGLEKWVQRHLGSASDQRLLEIVSAIRGDGPWGRCISGAMDVDNLDNVARVAFHIGLKFDPSLPLKIAQSAISVKADGFVFDDSAESLIAEWARLRAQVYEHLMPAAPDFAGKVMLIAAILQAFREGVFRKTDWKHTDTELTARLLTCGIPAVEEPIKRWQLGEPWNTSDLTWMEGNAPEYPQVAQYSEVLSKAIGRHCLAYRIKDKRHRSITITTVSGSKVTIGTSSRLWLLGVSSAVRRDFTAKENDLIVELAKEFFGCAPVRSSLRAHDAPLSLF